MASKARKAFDDNAKDIERLIDLHSQNGGNSRGRRFGLEVLNKSAVVLITAFWEAYCEDIAEEALVHIIEHSRTADVLPDDLKKNIAKELSSAKHELAMWQLAGDGWKQILRSRFDQLTEQRNRRLNTPKSSQIDEHFLTTLGLKEVSKSWRWDRKMSSSRAVKKLDRFVELRGAIAHRGAGSKSVTKSEVVDYFEFIKRIASKTGGAVNTHVNSITGVPLW